MIELAVGIFNGIGIGSVLLIAALGLAIVFGLMGVINLAHGELMMLGAYATFVVQNLFRDLGDGVFGLYIFVALPVAFLVSALAGLILERGVIRFLYGRPLETLLATWGVSLILRQLVRSVNWLLAIAIVLFCALFFGGMWLLRRRPNWEGMKGWAIAVLLPLSLAISGLAGWAMTRVAVLAKPWFGPRNLDVTAPAWLRGGFELGGYQLPYSRIFIILLTLLCLVAIYWFLNRSDWGLRIRSVTQNREMSACLGIPTDTVDALTFALGSGLAGIAGCAITFLGSVGPNVGQNYIVDTFMVVVVGGVGNIFGAIIAAFAIGISSYLLGSGALARLFDDINSLQFVAEFLRFFASTSMAKVMVFALIIAFLQVKPSGIFPQKGRTAEL
ncbi:MAG: ABC-type high affinity urea uptake system permease component UrtB [Phormidium sp. OSCR]|nr:MAG: ABC-type high affinity urea uptake system permease component UrtB [Phormidium sp. OSCR]